MPHGFYASRHAGPRCCLTIEYERLVAERMRIDTLGVMAGHDL